MYEYEVRTAPQLIVYIECGVSRFRRATTPSGKYLSRTLEAWNLANLPNL